MNNKQRGKGTEETMSYFVVEHGTEIVRAVQSRLRYALNYSSPNHTIYGPMTVETFHILTGRDRFGNLCGKGAQRAIGTDDKGNISTGIL